MVCDTCKGQGRTAYGAPCGLTSSPKPGRPVFSPDQEQEKEISGEVADRPGGSVSGICVC